MKDYRIIDSIENEAYRKVLEEMLWMLCTLDEQIYVLETGIEL